MARPIRLDYSDTYYHILSRGNERKEIFRDNDDYLKFTHFLEKMVEKFRMEIHAYVLMSNHYHLIVKTGDANLSKAIQWLGLSYSMWFNRRHGRSGHLFQGRFKSFIVEDDQYLTALCLYIHRNPIRAGITEKLSNYPWSSFPVYSGQKSGKQWLKTTVVLGSFGNNRKAFNDAQREYAGEESSLFDDLQCSLFLGSEAFAESWQEQLKAEEDREKPQSRKIAITKAIKDVIAEALRALGEKNVRQILRPLRREKRPNRDLAMYILSRMGIYTHREIGKEFGVGYTSVTGALIRAEEYLENDRSRRKEIEQIINGI